MRTYSSVQAQGHRGPLLKLQTALPEPYPRCKGASYTLAQVNKSHPIAIPLSRGMTQSLEGPLTHSKWDASPFRVKLFCFIETVKLSLPTMSAQIIFRLLMSASGSSHLTKCDSARRLDLAKSGARSV